MAQNAEGPAKYIDKLNHHLIQLTQRGALSEQDEATVKKSVKWWDNNKAVPSSTRHIYGRNRQAFSHFLRISDALFVLCILAIPATWMQESGAIGSVKDWHDRNPLPHEIVELLDNVFQANFSSVRQQSNAPISPKRSLPDSSEAPPRPAKIPALDSPSWQARPDGGQGETDPPLAEILVLDNPRGESALPQLAEIPALDSRSWQTRPDGRQGETPPPDVLVFSVELLVLMHSLTDQTVIDSGIKGVLTMPTKGQADPFFTFRLPPTVAWKARRHKTTKQFWVE